jgi:hypothetical protein
MGMAGWRTKRWKCYQHVYRRLWRRNPFEASNVCDLLRIRSYQAKQACDREPTTDMPAAYENRVSKRPAGIIRFARTTVETFAHVLSLTQLRHETIRAVEIRGQENICREARVVYGCVVHLSLSEPYHNTRV